MTKACSKCGETKPLSDFHRSATGKHGVQSHCKPCKRAMGAAHRRANAEKAAAYVASLGGPAAVEKTCSKCGEVKPLTEFYKDPSWKYGVRGGCKACTAAAHAAYRHADPEKAAASVRTYRRANPGKRAAWSAKYRRDNPDKLTATRAKYRKANPHMSWEFNYRKRCREFGFTPIIVSFTREDVVAQYGDGCFYCDTGAFEALDHYIPVVAGGAHTLENVRPSCQADNLRKRDTADRDAVAAFRRSFETDEQESAS